jgi:hypothetical protein
VAVEQGNQGPADSAVCPPISAVDIALCFSSVRRCQLQGWRLSFVRLNEDSLLAGGFFGWVRGGSAVCASQSFCLIIGCFDTGCSTNASRSCLRSSCAELCLPIGQQQFGGDLARTGSPWGRRRRGGWCRRRNTVCGRRGSRLWAAQGIEGLVGGMPDAVRRARPRCVSGDRQGSGSVRCEFWCGCRVRSWPVAVEKRSGAVGGGFARSSRNGGLAAGR